MCEVHSEPLEVLLIMWKNPQWHFNVVCISFGLNFNLILPKTEYFPVVILKEWVQVFTLSLILEMNSDFSADSLKVISICSTLSYFRCCRIGWIYWPLL